MLGMISLLPSLSKYAHSHTVTSDDQVKAYIKKIMSQLNKWMLGQKISKLVIVITSKETGEHVERWQFDVSCSGLKSRSGLTSRRFSWTSQTSPNNYRKYRIKKMQCRSMFPLFLHPPIFQYWPWECGRSTNSIHWNSDRGRDPSADQSTLPADHRISHLLART